MRAIRRPLRATVGVFAAGYIALPLPLPLPTPSGLPTALPTPSLPSVVATPSLPSLATPIAQPSAAASPVTGATGGGSGQGVSSTGTTDTSQQGSPKHGVAIPFTSIYVSSPVDVALLGALATLPLLFGIWLLLFGRTLVEARRAREAQVRLMLAADLGMRPKDLISMSTKALFSLREKSTFDELTGVLRRVAGISVADREIARAQRHRTRLTIAFVDIDGLQEANDEGGHAAGDALLLGLTRALKDGLRADDVVVRYGGDEFVCILPDLNAREARTKLSEVQVEAAKQGIRFCIGVAELQRGDDVVSLLARADGDLYEFKANRGEIVQLPARTDRGLTSASS